MGLNVEVGTKVLDTSTGVKTYSLPANFFPKLLIVWTTHQTADGLEASDGTFAYGVTTDLGAGAGVKTSAFISFLLDPSNTASRITRYATIGQAASPNPLLLRVGQTLDAVTVDWDCRFDGFGDAEWRIEVGDAPGTTGIRLHYIVLGGSDITRVEIGNQGFTTVGEQDVPLTAGQGQPDLVHAFGVSKNGHTASGEVAAAHFLPHIGWAVSDTERRCVNLLDQDAAATMVSAAWQKDRLAMGMTSAAAADWEMDLAARANWPADGFRVNVTDAPAATVQVYFVAIWGTFKKKIGSALTPTTNVAVDNDAGFPPKLGLAWGTVMPASTAIQRAAANADAVALGIGATDGTNECAAVISQDDGKTTSFGRSRSSTAKAYSIHEAVAGAVRAEADGSFTGNNFRLTYTTSHATQRQLSWIVLGDSVSLPPRRRDRQIAAVGQMV